MLLFTISFENPDEQAYFSELYLKHRDRMYTIAYSILGNAADAEDAVSDAVLSLTRKILDMREEEDYKSAAYLYKAAKHSALNIKRTRNRHPEAELSDYIVETVPEEDIPSDIAWIVDEIRHLDDLSRDILSLHYLNGLSPAEIADTLHMNLNTVRTRLSRGRKKLIEQLKKCM